MNDTEFMDSITELERGLVEFYVENAVLQGARTVLEIGSGWGIFARAALMANPELHLTTIDVQDKLESFDANTEGLEIRIERVVGDSKKVLKSFVNETFDIVLVDGDHGYESAFSDLTHAMRLVRPGGLIFVDDVLHHNNFKGDYKVMKALRDYALENKVEFKVHPVAHGVAVIEKI